MKAKYIDNMGDDLSVVNAAKVSFGKRSKLVCVRGCKGPNVPCTKECADKMALSKQDQGLIQFLARGCTSGDWDKLSDVVKGDWSEGKPETVELIESTLNHIRKMPAHWSPFAHTAITLHLKMPIFVARQIMKHTTGIEYNEISRRYVDSDPEFYVPDVWRKKADNVKQGSSDESVVEELFPEQENPNLWSYMLSPEEAYKMHVRSSEELYSMMIANGVAPEQARVILPQSMYTEVIATGNLYAWANMYNQRTDSHAQKETQDLAKQIGDIVKPLYPVSWEALTK